MTQNTAQMGGVFITGLDDRIQQGILVVFSVHKDKPVHK